MTMTIVQVKTPQLQEIASPSHATYSRKNREKWVSLASIAYSSCENDAFSNEA